MYTYTVITDSVRERSRACVDDVNIVIAQSIFCRASRKHRGLIPTAKIGSCARSLFPLVVSRRCLLIGRDARTNRRDVNYTLLKCVIRWTHGKSAVVSIT